MKIRASGRAQREGVSKKTGNPCDLNRAHYNGPDRGVEALAACSGGGVRCCCSRPVT